MMCRIALRDLCVCAAGGAVEAEAALFGWPLTLSLCGVIGCHVSGDADTFCSSTDIVLAVMKVTLFSLLLSLFLFLIFAVRFPMAAAVVSGNN